MAGAKRHVSNFSHLAAHDEQLARLGVVAECSFSDNSNTPDGEIGQRTPVSLAT